MNFIPDMHPLQYENIIKRCIKSTSIFALVNLLRLENEWIINSKKEIARGKFDDQRRSPFENFHINFREWFATFRTRGDRKRN